MSIQKRESTEAHPINVQVRRGPGGGYVYTEMSVDCPRRGRVPLDECRRCEFYDHTSLESDEPSVVCRRPEVAASAAEVEASEPAPRAEDEPSLAERTTLVGLFTRDVVCVSPEFGVDALAVLLLEQGLSGVPVVDQAGRPIGFVSKTDLVQRWYETSDAEERAALRAQHPLANSMALGPGFHPERLERATVGHIMTPLVTILPETATVAQAAARMVSEGLHRIPVVSAEGKVVGILSALDIMRWLATQRGYAPLTLEEALRGKDEYVP